MPSGFIVADKPAGMTSNRLVVNVRRLLPKGTAVGHGGTLDPDATGVLPLAIGSATRLFDYIIDKQKTYVAELRLGIVTDSQDASGNVIQKNEVNVTYADVIGVLPSFTGNIMQRPPMYSAIKRDGMRMYKLARKGEEIDLAPRPCRVDDIKYVRQVDETTHQIEVKCGRGVYIRTLCHDIGAALGCGGHMLSLRRTAAGAFRIEDAFTPDQILNMAAEGRLDEIILPPDAGITHLPRAVVYGRFAHYVRNGNPIKVSYLTEIPDNTGGPIRIYLEDAFAGIGEYSNNSIIRFKAMLLDASNK